MTLITSIAPPDSEFEKRHEEASKVAFNEAIRAAINRYSRENGSNTPDYILADYLCACLAAFEYANNTREKWHGYRLSLGRAIRIEEEQHEEAIPGMAPGAGVQAP